MFPPLGCSFDLQRQAYALSQNLTEGVLVCNYCRGFRFWKNSFLHSAYKGSIVTWLNEVSVCQNRATIVAPFSMFDVDTEYTYIYKIWVTMISL